MSPNENQVRRLHLELTSVFGNLETVVERTQAFMEDVTSDDDLVYRVVLLTSEAVTNAMEHGNGYDPAKQVVVDLRAYRDRIEVAVEDEGEGFAREAVENPLTKEHLLDDSGRGVFLMEHMADKVVWEKNGCMLRLVFQRSA